MRKKTILKIERDLKARAKKMRLGKKRAGAYVYGTLRKLRGNPRGVPKISDEAIRKMIRRYPASRRREAIFTLGISSGIPLSRIRRALKSNPATPQVDPPWNYGIYTGGGRVVRRIPTKIERLRKIVSERQNAVVDGSRVDLYSASAIVQVYDGLNPENRVKFTKLPVAKMASVAFKLINARDVKTNPANDVLELLSQDQIVKEYRKGAKGEPSKMMFTSKPMSGSSAAQLVRKIGNYNNFSWRRVMPFLGKLDYATAALPLPLEFRVGREYSPTIYIENVEMPRYANQIIEYARERLKVSEANYVPVARRIRLWWD